MSFLRTLPTRRLVVLLGALAALAAAGAAIAVASGGEGPTPAPKALDRAVHDALSGPPPAGITARVRFTNKLFPSGALTGETGSALMSGASGRLWLTNDGRGRIELQSDAGDVQLVWNGSTASVYDASSNTVYRADLGAGHRNEPSSKGDEGAAPALSEIDKVLSELGRRASLSGALPTNVAGRPAYSVSVSPRHDGGLLGSVALAWDAARGVPLRIAVFAQGSSSPVLALEATGISYGPVSAHDVDLAPPAGAKVVDVSSSGKAHPDSGGASVTGLDAVRAAAGFPVTAPDTLVGLPRKDVRLTGGSAKAAVVVYGRGLGAIVVVERAADAAAPSRGGVLSALPTVSLDGVSAHELATQLGTLLSWRQTGVEYVLAGSLPPAAAEAAARALR